MSGRWYPQGDFGPGQVDEHVVIHARVGDKGTFTQDDGSPLPALRPGAFVQLRLRATCLVDPKQRKTFSTRELRELLPRGQKVFAIVDSRSLEDHELAMHLMQAGLLDVLAQARDETRRYREQPLMESWSMRGEGPKTHEGLLEVILLEPLMMERKGLKPYRLHTCACVVPALKRPADGFDHDLSLNHALTRISEQLELHRISHTGNVFNRYLVPASADRDWPLLRLASRRDVVQN